jgi:hypothetical protein
MGENRVQMTALADVATFWRIIVLKKKSLGVASPLLGDIAPTSLFWASRTSF